MVNEEVLTDEESDALLEQSEDAQIESGIREPGSEFWEQVAVNRIPALDAIEDELARALGSVWQRVLQQQIVVTTRPLQRLSGRAFAKRIMLEQCVAAFDVQGRGEQVLLVLQPDTVSAMVDICFGGPGDSPRSDRLGELTEMEKRLLTRFTQAVGEAFAEVLQRRGSFALVAADKPFEAESSAMCEFSARLFMSAFSFDIAETEHTIEFVWSAGVIEDLRGQAPRALPGADTASSASWNSRLSADVQDASVEVRAVIGEIRTKLHQISRAKTGDIILTDPLTKVRLLAAGKPVFEGTLGTHNGFNAVKIVQPFNRKRSGEA